VESSYELGNEPSGSIKCWELPNGCTTCGLSSGTQLHRVSYLVIFLVHCSLSISLFEQIYIKTSNRIPLRLSAMPFHLFFQVSVTQDKCLSALIPVRNYHNYGHYLLFLFYLKYNTLEIVSVCRVLREAHTQLYSIDRASSCLLVGVG
jgi:hypothetical protein